MTSAAPTSVWRKICEQHLAHLVDELEPRVETEVESRVSTAIDAVIKGAVSDAVAATRQELAENLNQAARRLRQCAASGDAHAVLLAATAPFCDQAAVFTIQEKSARAECIRRPATKDTGAAAVEPPLQSLEVPFCEAAAFSTAIATRDPVIAMSTPGEVSPALVDLFQRPPDQKVYLFPLTVRQEVTALLYAAGAVQAAPLELLAEVTALHLETLAAAPKPADLVTTISGSLWKQPAEESGVAEQEPEMAVKKVPQPQPKPHREWWSLSQEEQSLHLSAQRFARVQVAEMRLYRPEAVQSARARRDLYAAFKDSIDPAREAFRQKFMSASPTMVDYLHLELVRSLADDDANLLGPDYPGPLA